MSVETSPVTSCSFSDQSDSGRVRENGNSPQAPDDYPNGRSSGASQSNGSDPHGWLAAHNQGLDQGNPIPIDADEGEAMTVHASSPDPQWSLDLRRTDTSEDSSHRRFAKVCTKNAKCDQCEERNVSVMQRCRSCSMTTCKACHDNGRYDRRHNLKDLPLDWERPTRDKRGRRAGGQSFSGVNKSKKGRPSKQPRVKGSDDAICRGLVREPPSLGKRKDPKVSSVAGLSGGISEDTNDTQSSLEDLTGDTDDLSYVDSSGQDTENSLIHAETENGDHTEDTIHVRTSNRSTGPYSLRDVRMDLIGALSTDSGDSSEVVPVQKSRRALPTARPQVMSMRSAAATRQFGITAANNGTRSQGIVDSLHRANIAGRVHRSPIQQHCAYSTRQRAGFDDQSSDLRGIALAAVSHENYRNAHPAWSPLGVPAPVDSDDGTQFGADTRGSGGGPGRNPEHFMVSQDTDYDASGSEFSNYASTNESSDGYSTSNTSKPGSIAAGQPPWPRNLGTPGHPPSRRPFNVQAYDGRASELTNNAYFRRENFVRPSPLGPGYRGAPDRMFQGVGHHQDRLRQARNYQRMLLSTMQSDWVENPAIKHERSTNGPLAALDMLQAGVMLKVMQGGLHPEIFQDWFNKMRAALTK